MNACQDQSSVLDRTSASGLRAMCVLRACLLGTGVAVAVAVDLASGPSRWSVQLMTAVVALWLFTTLTTFSPHFRRSSTSAMVTIALLDLVTLMLVFHLPHGSDVVESFIAVPGVWLGIVLGRRGVAVAATTCAALFLVPGLIANGVSGLGWHLGASVVVFAVIACAALVTSAQMWSNYTARLETTAEELRCALLVKDDFVSLVSHELRTPLTSILGYLDLAMDEVAGLPGPVGAHLSAVSRNADRLLVLITDLLAAERADRAPLQLSKLPTDISALAQLSVDDVALRAETASVSVTAEIEPGITIEADPTRILGVFDNLLSNAVKYTPPTGRVDLVLRREADQVLLEVTDTGIGIHAEDLPELFTKFFRARNATALAIPGIGLGLMITRAIVEAHGGSIEARSQEGVGTSITVSLPWEPQRPALTSRDPVLVDL